MIRVRRAASVELWERWAQELSPGQGARQVYDVAVDGAVVGHLEQSRVGWWMVVPHRPDGVPVRVSEWVACKTQHRAVAKLVQIAGAR